MISARGGQRVCLVFAHTVQRRGVILDVDRDGQGASVQWDDTPNKTYWWDIKYLMKEEFADGKVGHA